MSTDHTQLVTHAAVPTLLAAGPLPLLALGQVDIGRAVLFVLFLIMCVAVHEFGHAWVADRLGDPLPRQQGRVTLNPMAHADLLGTILLPLLLAATGGHVLGWGKPVEWTGHPRYLTRRFTLRTMHLLVSVAGPAMNLLMAVLVAAVVVLVARLGHRETLGTALELGIGLVSMNLMLMFFNLLPVPPLDGRSFLYFLPDSFEGVRSFLFRYGGFIFLALVLTGPIYNGMSLLGIIMYPFTYVSGLFIQGVLLLALG